MRKELYDVKSRKKSTMSLWKWTALEDCCLAKKREEEMDKSIEFANFLQEAMFNFSGMMNKRNPEIRNYRGYRKLYEEIRNKMYEYFLKHEDEVRISYPQFLVNHTIINSLEFDTHENAELNVLLDLFIYDNPMNNKNLCTLFLNKGRVRTEDKIAMIHAMQHSQFGLFEYVTHDSNSCVQTLRNVLTGEIIEITGEKMYYNHDIKNLYFVLRIIQYKDVAFQSGLQLTFEEKNKGIKNWITYSRARHHHDAIQLVELFLMQKEKVEKVRVAQPF